ncbi:MAG: hypothetical protein ABI645_14935 [Pseudomonadota bacterium]
MTPFIAMPAGTAAPSDPQVAGGVGEFPKLPVLTDMLHGARRLSDAPDWRSGVLAALDMPNAASQNAAMIAARSIPALQPGSGICLALPVHAVAGMSRMFLGTARTFVVDPDEREALRLAFNAEFGTPEVQMHAAGCGWLLGAPFAAAANDGSPESLLGVALAREPAVSEGGRSLRRLGAEVEMWLAGLPFNAARERRGEPVINSIWFWSGATAVTLPAPGRMPCALFTNTEPDAWITGLASHCGLPLRQAHSWQEVRDTPGAFVILQPPLPGDAMPQMPEWESAWLEPARRDLASRRLQALRLQIGRSAWQLPAPRLSRWLQRRRPWWQRVYA